MNKSKIFMSNLIYLYLIPFLFISVLNKNDIKISPCQGLLLYARKGDRTYV